MLTRFVVAALAIAATGCATTHPGEIAASTAKDVVISVERNEDISDKYYYFYEYTIENPTAEWKDVQITNVHFEGEQNEVLSGDKLASWIEGAELKLRAAQYNKDLLLGSLIAVGGIAAATSNNSSVQTAGAATALGAAGVAAGTNISQAKNKATTGVKGVNGTVNVPSTHVFVPSKVAPESFIRRWVVVKAPTSELNNRPASPTAAVNNGSLVSDVKIDATKEAKFTATVITSLRDVGSEFKPSQFK